MNIHSQINKMLQTYFINMFDQNHNKKLWMVKIAIIIYIKTIVMVQQFDQKKLKLLKFLDFGNFVPKESSFLILLDVQYFFNILSNVPPFH